MTSYFLIATENGSVLQAGGIKFAPVTAAARCRRFATAEKAYGHLSFLKTVHHGSDTLRSAFVCHARRAIELAGR